VGNATIPAVGDGPSPPALVLGKHITALGTLRVLARQGVDVRCVEATPGMLGASRWYRAADRRLPETEDSDALADYLRSLDLSGAVLVPCSDKWVAAVASLPGDVAARFPSSLPGPEVVAQVLDKDRFRERLASLGLPAPRTSLLATPEDVAAVSTEQVA